MTGQRSPLGRRLRDLRAGPFRSGSAFARNLGWQQSKVSRIELGNQLPSRADLAAWADAVGAGDDVRTELHDLLDEAHVRTVSNRGASRGVGGLHGAQDDLGALERTSTLIAEYQPHMVPGLAQTAAYTRAWLRQPGRPSVAEHIDVEAIVAARSARQAVLHDPGRRIVLGIGEAALRNVHGDVDLQRRQLAYLQVIADLPSVELLVEPFAAATATVRGYEVLDDRVILEDTDGARHLTDPAIVARFGETLEALRSRAVSGTDAGAVIDEAARAIGG